MEKWNFYAADELKPAGWLRRQLEIQAHGLCGNLDKIWPDVRDSAWIGGNREGWERVPYWLNGFIPLAYLLEDSDMIARAKRYVDAILASQNADGWICPCSEEARASYDTWAVLLITKTLKVYYDCSKDPRIPDVLYRVLKNYYRLLESGQIQLFNWGKFRWFEGMIAIRFVYDRCREPWLIALARILKEQGADYRTYAKLWEHPGDERTFNTHIVNIGMMFKAETVTCDLLGEPYRDDAEYLRQILERYHGTVYESFTGDEHLTGLSPIQGTELCAIVEQMYSYELLYAYTGDAKWAERLEVLAFNALPGTISADMWTHQYDQLSNQIACERFPGKPIFSTNDADAHLFGLEPNFGCCTANFGQGWPKLALSAFLHRENTVHNALMIPSELRTETLRIRLETNYPFENSACYRIETEKAFTFQIRIPAFAENLTVNGAPETGRVLTFAVEPGKTEYQIAFETKPQFLRRPYGLYAVRCGSLLFSVPIRSEKKAYEYERDGVERRFPYCDYELTPISEWEYAYLERGLTVWRRAPGETPFPETDPPVTVTAQVQKIRWGLEPGYGNLCARMPESLEPISEPHEIALYPYGCAKLRMTELPLLDAQTGRREKS